LDITLAILARLETLRNRGLLWLVVGVNTALRISDLLELRIENFLTLYELKNSASHPIHNLFSGL
jgi:hypothetical protein